jgi:glutamate-1-semialdehyde 2,1-aminomutase
VNDRGWLPVTEMPYSLGIVILRAPDREALVDMVRYLRETARYLGSGSQSRQRLADSENLMPDGITRETIRREPLAPWMAHAHGTRLVDVDGDERIDFVFNHTALVHGHNFEPVVSAIANQVRTLEAMSFPNAYEARLASLLAPRVPITAPYFRFTSSGSEAVLLALQLAQEATQRNKIVVFEDCYHGGFVATSHKRIASPDYIICPFGDVEGMRNVFATHGTEIAAVLADLCPVRGALAMASPDFAGAIGDECARSGALLVADEVVSSRAAPTGIVAQYGLTPDIVCLGKYIGGGLPTGVIAFGRDLVRYFGSGQQPTLGHGGTYNGNPLSMAAGTAAMQVLDGARTARLDAAAESLCDDLEGLFSRRRSDWTVRRAGSLFHLWPYRELPSSPSGVSEQRKARQAIRELSEFVLCHGAVIAPSGFGCVATVTTSADISYLVSALDAYLVGH